ncbi:hypothetical protein B296_00058468 [Ensete ventricosum]|uniref:Uncharacterized protein n=1 Tax=Ensete ventricosum TaxID=4639 RepID=A0A426XMA6_ENSVE|nr:hypothetical protein B296_00058468 [Ensete ventricosum]
MASKLHQLRSKAVQASDFIAKHGSTYYKELLEKNKQYIVQPPTIETCQDLSKKLFYTRLARYIKLSNQPQRGTDSDEIYNSVILVLKQAICSTNAFSLYSIPGRYESFWKELDGVKHIWRNRQDLKVEDVSIAALFGLELYAWFCVGEIVGRGFTFTGYYV